MTGWENNRDYDITRPLSLKTMEVHIKRDQWIRGLEWCRSTTMFVWSSVGLTILLWRHLCAALFPLLRHDQHLWIKESISDQMRSDITCGFISCSPLMSPYNVQWMIASFIFWWSLYVPYILQTMVLHILLFHINYWYL